MGPVLWLKTVMTAPSGSPELGVAWDMACEAGLVYICNRRDWLNENAQVIRVPVYIFVERGNYLTGDLKADGVCINFSPYTGHDRSERRDLLLLEGSE